MECCKKHICRNYPYKCGECYATSDLRDNYPCFKDRFDDMDYADFLDELEILAVSKGLRLRLERSPLGSGFFLYFVNDFTQKRSEAISWLHHKVKFKDIYDELSRLADVFKNEEPYKTPELTEETKAYIREYFKDGSFKEYEEE